jgi:hippurate hydrolase
MTSGSTANVFPNEAVLEGTLRTFSLEVLETVLGRINSVTKSVTAAFGCTSELEVLSDCAPTINHKLHAAIVRQAVVKAVGAENLIPSYFSAGSEDFAYYLLKIPGAFFGLFSGKPLLCHTTHYDFVDEMLPYAIRIFLNILSIRFGVEFELKL